MANIFIQIKEKTGITRNPTLAKHCCVCTNAIKEEMHKKKKQRRSPMQQSTPHDSLHSVKDQSKDQFP